MGALKCSGDEKQYEPQALKRNKRAGSKFYIEPFMTDLLPLLVQLRLLPSNLVVPCHFNFWYFTLYDIEIMIDSYLFYDVLLFIVIMFYFFLLVLYFFTCFIIIIIFSYFTVVAYSFFCGGAVYQLWLWCLLLQSLWRSHQASFEGKVFLASNIHSCYRKG